MSRALATTLALLVLVVAVTPVAARDPQAAGAPVAAGAVIPGQVIVEFRPGAAAEVARTRGLAIASTLGASADRAPVLVSTGGRSVEAVLGELRRDPSVLHAEPNYTVQLADAGAVTVNDPDTDGQYSLDQMRVRDAWSMTTGGGNVVAVLDTGIQLNHPDLAGRIVAGYDFVNDDTNPSDDNGHGTWVSGIIAANANDGYGIAGISWSDSIMPVKVMDREGTGSTADLLAGIRWAADHGADVINMSVGGFPYSQIMQDAINEAWSEGVVLVGAAGNNRREETYYPASFDNVISVSATQPEDEFSNWSSYGPKVDVSAPGSSVLTTNCYACTYADHDSWGTHTYISGTSFATPNVVGVVALLRAAFPTESPAQVVDRLIAGTDDLGYPGWDNRYGTGRVNALRSLGVGVSAAALAAGDAWESNNVLGTARAIQMGVTFRPSIHPAGDVDWFRVQVPRAGRLEVRATGIVDNRAYPWNKSGLPIDPIVGLYTTSGTLLKVVDNEWEGGTELASYSFAEATTVAIRISNWYPNGNPGSYTLSTAFVDEVPPRVLHLVPGPNAEMVLPRARITFDVSEPVTGLDASTVTLVMLSGRSLPAHVTYVASSGHVTVIPDAPLPSDATIVLRLSTSIKDSAGLTFAYQGYRFRTMPGQTFLPSRAVRFSPGTQVGHRIGAGGAILGLHSGRLAKTSTASSPQRAVLPNLPGAWLLIENGMWAGTWIRESARAFVAGTTELRPLPATTRVVFLMGVRTGRTYAENGSVTSTKTVTIKKASGANTDGVAIINGVRHYHVTNGLFAGRWVAESTGVYRPGLVERMNFAPIHRIQIAAGTHVGVTLASDGRITGWKSARLAWTSGANVSAWAVVNGVPRVLVTSGIWAGMWLPAEDVLAYEH